MYRGIKSRESRSVEGSRKGNHQYWSVPSCWLKTQRRELLTQRNRESKKLSKTVRERKIVRSRARERERERERERLSYANIRSSTGLFDLTRTTSPMKTAIKAMWSWTMVSSISLSPSPYDSKILDHCQISLHISRGVGNVRIALCGAEYQTLDKTIIMSGFTTSVIKKPEAQGVYTHTIFFFYQMCNSDTTLS